MMECHLVVNCMLFLFFSKTYHSLGAYHNSFSHPNTKKQNQISTLDAIWYDLARPCLRSFRNCFSTKFGQINYNILNNRNSYIILEICTTTFRGYWKKCFLVMKELKNNLVKKRPVQAGQLFDQINCLLLLDQITIFFDIPQTWPHELPK